jgi:hypothetical protein
MVNQPDGREQRDPNVIRLSQQYASCPTRQLILPLYDDPTVRQAIKLRRRRRVLPASTSREAHVSVLMRQFEASPVARWSSSGLPV